MASDDSKGIDWVAVSGLALGALAGGGMLLGIQSEVKLQQLVKPDSNSSNLPIMPTPRAPSSSKIQSPIFAAPKL